MSERSESKGSVPEFPPGWCCYLLLCADGGYYCGLTSKLSQRLRHHASGKGSTYTKGTRPIALVWYEAHPQRASAAARERQLKKWSHMKKHALAQGRLSPAKSAASMWVSLA
ncbi:MAG: GIY-YIG nuclease family protein [Acidobacteria bacterium]|nr:GIY-YIG nuclease family protein [Acidobacteriota bacterium]